MPDQFLTPQEARERWSRDHNLPAEMAPRYPEGTCEYAQYAAQLRDELKRFGAEDRMM